MQFFQFGGGADVVRQAGLKDAGVDPGIGLVGRRGAELAERLQCADRQAEVEFFCQFAGQGGDGVFARLGFAAGQHKGLGIAFTHQQQAAGIVDQAGGGNGQGGHGFFAWVCVARFSAVSVWQPSHAAFTSMHDEALAHQRLSLLGHLVELAVALFLRLAHGLPAVLLYQVGVDLPDFLGLVDGR
ncbi:hypothetical protein D9M68_734280 [compost metagenome]